MQLCGVTLVCTQSEVDQLRQALLQRLSKFAATSNDHQQIKQERYQTRQVCWLIIAFSLQQIRNLYPAKINFVLYGFEGRRQIQQAGQRCSQTYTDFSLIPD